MTAEHTPDHTSSGNTASEQQDDHKHRFEKLQAAQPTEWHFNRGYSTFIKFFRRFMVLGALILIMAVALWLNMDEEEPRVQPQQADETRGEAALIKAQFDGIDTADRPYRVTADKTVQQSDNQDLYRLTQPMADILTSDQRWMAASAARGTYNQEDETLELEENVKIFYDDGMEFTLQKAQLDLKNNTARSDLPLTGRGPAGAIDANGLDIQAAGETIIFQGPAKLTLNQAGR